MKCRKAVNQELFTPIRSNLLANWGMTTDLKARPLNDDKSQMRIYFKTWLIIAWNKELDFMEELADHYILHSGSVKKINGATEKPSPNHLFIDHFHQQWTNGVKAFSEHYQRNTQMQEAIWLMWWSVFNGSHKWKVSKAAAETPTQIQVSGRKQLLVRPSNAGNPWVAPSSCIILAKNVERREQIKSCHMMKSSAAQMSSICFKLNKIP